MSLKRLKQGNTQAKKPSLLNRANRFVDANEVSSQSIVLDNGMVVLPSSVANVVIGLGDLSEFDCVFVGERPYCMRKKEVLVFNMLSRTEKRAWCREYDQRVLDNNYCHVCVVPDDKMNILKFYNLVERSTEHMTYEEFSSYKINHKIVLIKRVNLTGVAQIHNRVLVDKKSAAGRIKQKAVIVKMLKSSFYAVKTRVVGESEKTQYDRANVISRIFWFVFNLVKFLITTLLQLLVVAPCSFVAFCFKALFLSYVKERKKSV